MAKFHLPLLFCKFLVIERKNTLFVSALGQGRDEPRSSLHSSLAREPSRLSKRPSSEKMLSTISVRATEPPSSNPKQVRSLGFIHPRFPSIYWARSRRKETNTLFFTFY